MKGKRINPIVKLFFAASVCIVITVIIILVMGYRYMTFPDGKFMGRIKNNDPYSGIIKYSDGSEAELKEGVRLVYPNGDVYEGEMKNILRSGKGNMIYKNGDVYEGDFSNGQITGQGKYTYYDGVIYEGQFLNGVKEGNGVLTIPGNHIYTGSFHENMYEGHGVIEYLKGPETMSETTDASVDDTEPMESEENDFGDDAASDSDIVFTPYKKGDELVVGKYDGNFKNGVQSGEGEQWYSSGCYYKGEYAFGKKNGYGKLQWSNGASYEGTFYDDKYDTRKLDEKGAFIQDSTGAFVHGDKAVITDADGNVFTRYYEDGKPATVDEK